MNWRHALILTLGIGVLPALSATAADIWDNRSLKIVQQGEVVFPPALLHDGITEGSVRAVLEVDADGRLADCLIAAYTRPELAREVLSAVRDWEYEPARDRGQPTGSRVEVVFGFEGRGSVLSVSTLAGASLSMIRMLDQSNVTSLVCKATELDQPLTPVHVVSPRHPKESPNAARAGGRVLIDFYVDAEGRPRMPVVTRAPQEILAVAAVEALAQWRFTPPTRQGRPMHVRVVQTFVFPEGT